VNYKKVISGLHTTAVSKALCASTPNKVLGEYPPRINPEEETLAHAHPCALTQLHSGECHHLRTYLHANDAIDKADDNLCPEYGSASH
jgi:hypothetical protein